ncbi:hypothetical protein D3C79_544110 [compost metagenome]
MIALRRRAPLALRVLVPDHIAWAGMVTGQALEFGALRSLDARRPGIGQGALQQWSGIAVKFARGDLAGKTEEPPQPIQALLLFVKTLGNTAGALAGQQLEALAQLLFVEGVRGKCQGGGQQAARHQCNQRHRPGGRPLCAQAKQPRKHATL